MEKREGMLMWAGAAAVVGLLLGVAALVIAIIAAVSPPVRESVSGVMRGTDAVATVLGLAAPAAAIFLGGMMLTGVIQRRQVTFGMRTESQPRKPAIGLGVVLLVAMVVVVGASVSMTASISSLSDMPAGDVLAAPRFRGLAGSMGVMSLACSVVSHGLFAQWRYANAGAGRAVDALPQQA